MCGIIALYSQYQPVDEKDITAGLKALNHRGPDSQQYWFSQSKNLALGHTRLSIIDLQTGAQPISDHNNHTHIIVNGEFYDHENIRNQLIKEGFQFKTQSDSEIALHLYNKHGTACLSKLRGEFAFCLWDAENQFLFAARDRFGIKPLYYGEHNGKIYIASEIKAILAAGFPTQWDTDSYLTRAFAYRDRTLFKNVHQVPPGHCLLLTKNNIRTVKYWDFNYKKLNQNQTFDHHTVEDIRQSIIEAVRLRLRADVPIAVYLSGGIDSSAILGIAHEYHSQPIEAFTLSFSDSCYDELNIAKETAQHTGAILNPVHISQKDLADNFANAIWYSENTFINAHGIAKYLLSKAVHKSGYKVVLTGEGADEIFAGYLTFVQDQISHTHNKKEQLLKRLRSENIVSEGLLLTDKTALGIGIDFLHKKLGFTPSWLIAQLEMTEKFISLYKKDCFEQASASRPILQFINHLDLIGQIQNRDFLHKSMYLISKSLLVNYILTILGDRMEMAHSIEGRTPFLDHHLVEKVTQIAPVFKINGLTEKYILRQAVQPWVTNTVYKRKKHPFLAPPSILKQNDKLFEYTRDTFNSSSAMQQPFYDIKKINSFLDKATTLKAEDKISSEPIIMEILSLCVLQDTFFKDTKRGIKT